MPQRRTAEDDPLHKLPVLKVLGSMFSGDMTLALKDMKVVEDLLKPSGGRALQ